MSKLSAKHFILFILGVTFISFKTYPSIFINIGGRDTWFYTMISFLLFLLFSMYLIFVMDSRKTYDLNKIFNTSSSKFLGNILLFLFSFGLFLAALEAATVEANAIKTNYFMETPIWYILFFFLLPSFFIIGKRFITFLTFIIITSGSLILNVIVLFLLTDKYKNMDFITPVLSNGFNFDIIKTTILILGSLSSFVICLPYLKYLAPNSKLKKHTLIGNLFIGFICVYSIIGVIATFGPLRASNLFYPEYIQSQLVQIGGFIEFGELFFVYQSVIGMFLKYIIATYAIYLLYEKLITNKNLFITVYSLAIFIAANFLAANNYILFYILEYYQYINILLFILIPLIVFILFQLRVPKTSKK